MAVAVNEQIVDAVTGENMKVVGGAPSFYQNQAMQDAVHFQRLAHGNSLSHQAALNQVREAILMKGVKDLLEVDPIEAVSTDKILSGDLANKLSQLLAALSSNQQGAKVAQSTPPETAVPKA